LPDQHAGSAESLQALTARYEAILAVVPDIIMEVDNNKVYTWANRAGYEFFGEDVLGKEAAHYFEGEQETYSVVQPLFNGHEDVIYVESWQRRKDGEKRLLAWWCRTLKDADGNVIGTLSTARDITERKQAEGALRDSRHMLQAVLDSIPAAVFWKDRDSTYLGGNRTWLEAAGLESSEEVVGKSDYDLPWEKEQADSFREDDRRVMESGVPEFGIIEPYLRADGTHAWAKTNKVPLRDLEGNVVGVLGTYEDITERRRAEEELRQYIERLRNLRAIDGAILAAWSSEDIAQAVLRHVRQLIPCQRASVTTLDQEQNLATVLALHANGETRMEVGSTVSLEGLSRLTTLERAKVHAVNDISALTEPSELEQTWLAEGIRSYINIPLIAHGELIGSLSLAAEIPNAFSPVHVEVAHELAGQLAIALQQARLHEQVQRHAEELEAEVFARTAELARRTIQLQVAAEVARDVTSAGNLDDLLSHSANLIQERFGFDHAGIFLVSEQNEYAVLKAATGEAGRQMLARDHRLKVGEEGIVGYVTGSGEPRIALDVGKDAVHFDNPLLPSTRSEMALPLQVGERIIGALDVQSNREAAFDEEDLEILQLMADQLAAAIEKTRLFERAQAVLEEQLRTVVSNTPVVLFALDKEGAFTLLEGKSLDVLGLRPGEVVGQPVADIFAGFPKAIEGARRALSGETAAMIVEGLGLVFDTQYTPLRDESGEVIGAIGVATDITERRKLERQIEQQERLAAIGQLAGGIAHDFNNLLTTIILYAQMGLGNGSLSPQVTRSLETILGEARRAAELVQQILDFSRRSPMQKQFVDLEPFIKETFHVLQRTIPENISVDLEVGPGEYVVHADPTRIQQVLMNLVVNARDAMPDGGKLDIRLSRIDAKPGKKAPMAEMAPGEWICLSVSDTGTGISPDVLPHIYEPFFTTKPVGQGTGLGLAQVYGIVKQHEGHVNVETETGRGSTFLVYLPAHRAEERSSDEAKLDIPAGQGETVLLVEDNEKLLEASRGILESLGYRVLTATNGQAALEIYRSQKADLVLTDVVMPEMGGADLVQHLRSMDPELKAIAITGHAMAEDLKELREAGLAGIVYKPLDVTDLAQVVRRALDADE
jgi:PAS domain S-box-containing protein